MSPRFLSLFAGVGGFDLGLEAAGWECAGQVELDPFCVKVLERRWPGARRWTDVRTYGPDAAGGEAAGDAGGAGLRAERGEPVGRGAAVDLLVGGFPCQGASVAGKRLGLTDDRTALFWEILRVQDQVRAPWALLENVPGLRSVGLGHDFPTVVAALAERWPAVGWRTLDSRFFHVAQRRERVFFVCGPSEAGVAAVLFELAGGGGDREAGGEARPEPATGPRLGVDVARSLGRVGGGDYPGANKGTLVMPDVAYALAAAKGNRFGSGRQNQDTFVVGTLNGSKPGGGWRAGPDEAAAGQLVVASPLSAGSSPNSNMPGRHREDDVNLVVADPLSASEGKTYTHEGATFRLHNVVAFKPSHYSRGKDGAPSEVFPPLSADADRGDQDPVVFESRLARNGRGAPEEIAPPLKAESGQTGKGDAAPLVYRKAQKAHDPEDCERWEETEHIDTLAGHGTTTTAAILEHASVRRLTPLECERLQGFPDGWSCLCQPLEAYRGEEDVDEVALRCSCPDGPRYRALGNAVTVNVVAWLGLRLRQLVA